MKINIVCDEPDSWVYGDFIAQFKKYSKHEILINAVEGFDLVHYLPYYNFFNMKRTTIKPITAWFSHMEQKEGLKNQFIITAQNVDCVISHSKKYASFLNRVGAKKVQQIMPGVDFSIYKPRRSGYNINRGSKLIIGYIGRSYTSSNRKNTQLLEKVGKIKGVELRITGGKVEKTKMPTFYEEVDLVISPSKVEGGPLSLQESLAMGKPFICFDDVGVAREFNYGVIRVPDFNEAQFIETIENFRDGLLILPPPRISAIENMRNQVLQYTQEKFVEEHDKLWEELCLR